MFDTALYLIPLEGIKYTDFSHSLRIVCGLEDLPPFLSWLPVAFRILAFVTFFPILVLLTADVGGYIIFRALYQPIGKHRTMFYKFRTIESKKNKEKRPGVDAVEMVVPDTVEASSSATPAHDSALATVKDEGEEKGVLEGYSEVLPSSSSPASSGSLSSKETSKSQTSDSSSAFFCLQPKSSFDENGNNDKTTHTAPSTPPRRSDRSGNFAVTLRATSSAVDLRTSPKSSTNGIRKLHHRHHRHPRHRIRRRPSFYRARAKSVGVDGPLGFESIQTSPFQSPRPSPSQEFPPMSSTVSTGSGNGGQLHCTSFFPRHSPARTPPSTSHSSALGLTFGSFNTRIHSRTSSSS